MKIIDNRSKAKWVYFKEVGVGETFYYDDSPECDIIYMKILDLEGEETTAICINTGVVESFEAEDCVRVLRSEITIYDNDN